MKNIDKEIMLSEWYNNQQQGLDEAGFKMPDFIIESWKRSKNYNVDALKPHNDEILNKDELNRRIRNNRAMLDIAIPAMEDLAAITKGSGFCIVITDNEGYILKRIGNKHELDFTQYGNFVEGANWSERVMGTNAVALALLHNRPVQVFGYEHYCKCACLSTCSAAPIHNSNGEIIGILDLTGPFKLSNGHTLGMAEASAKAIERTMELNRINKEIQKSDIQKEAIIESIMEGIIAIDSSGIITHINKHAQNYLKIKETDCIGKNLRTLIEDDNEYFFDLVFSDRHRYGDIVSIKIGRERKRYLLNLTPLRENGLRIGNIIVLFEMKPIHKMVNIISGARANITFDHLIGKSSNFAEAIEQAKMAAQTDSNVVLLGESGVGKDLFAQSIHNASNRKRETFLAVNCAAIPRDLITSELFGHEEGAFTGARKQGNPGKFEMADQGTLFLDEIAEAPIDLQATLLRVLEEKSILRLGGREIIPVNVRLVCATNKDLRQEISNGSFRQDLYFRLGVISIMIPSLRERRSDIPLLIDHFVESISKRLGKIVLKVDQEVYDVLMSYDWPGNVRELQNIIERAINLMKFKEVTLDLLPLEALNKNTNFINIWEEELSKDELEKKLIIDYLDRFHNKSDVAKALKISRSSLYRKMNKYGINY